MREQLDRALCCRIPAAILNRFDIRLHVDTMQFHDIDRAATSDSTATVAARIVAAQAGLGGALTIRDSSVVGINGFPVLIETGEIIVTDGSIESLVGLTALKEVSSSMLLRNSRLTDLSGLSALETIGGALMMLDTQTTDLRPLDNVRTIGGSLYINRSPIAQLGLARLEAVELEVLITETTLASMNGLNALRTVGSDLRITNNGNLPGDAARAWADEVDVLGETVVCQNLEGDLDPC